MFDAHFRARDIHDGAAAAACSPYWYCILEWTAKCVRAKLIESYKSQQFRRQSSSSMDKKYPFHHEHDTSSARPMHKTITIHMHWYELSNERWDCLRSYL